MSENKKYYKGIAKLRSVVKARRQKELYDMIEDKNNQLEDKIALLKISFKEINTEEMINSLSEVMGDKKK